MCVHVCSWVQVYTEARRGRQVPWTWSNTGGCDSPHMESENQTWDLCEISNTINLLGITTPSPLKKKNLGKENVSMLHCCLKCAPYQNILTKFKIWASGSALWYWTDSWAAEAFFLHTNTKLPQLEGVSRTAQDEDASHLCSECFPLVLSWAH